MKRCTDAGSGSEKRRASLTTVQPGSGETVNHFDLLNLDFDLPRSKFTLYGGSRASMERSTATPPDRERRLGFFASERFVKEKNS